MVSISISPHIQTACPGLHIAAITCTVVNTPSDPSLWNEIAVFENEFKTSYHIEDINKRKTIRATREAYKALGKDPNRYRPSAESLCRRIAKNLPLYRIDTLVDLINLVSLQTGYSIGGFDADKIEGDLVLGVGEAGELFHAIGRGQLNIQGLPVYRDTHGGIGTPTSDEERTKIGLDTRRLLMIINGYTGREGLDAAVMYSIQLLKRYVSAQNIHAIILNRHEIEELSLNNV